MTDRGRVRDQLQDETGKEADDETSEKDEDGQMALTRWSGLLPACRISKVITLKSVDQILRDHGLTRENAKQYICRSPAYNRQDIAEDMELSQETVHRYKREFQEMDAVTRSRIIGELGTELHRELADGGLS